MPNVEQRVRETARDFNDAIVAARAAGYRVDWPVSSDGLAAIAVSETRRFGQAARPAPGDEYEHMTKHALEELATARGIAFPSGAKKADVIAVLKTPPAPVSGL